MAIKFYADEHIHPGVVKALRNHGVDVLTAQQAGMLGIDDEVHLEFSSSQDRVLIKHDQDFLNLQWNMNHRRIVYAHRQTPMRRIIEGIILIYEAMTEEEMENHIEYL